MRRIFKLKYSAFIFLMIIFISSCRVEKRHYTKGYYVAWHKTRTVKDKETFLKPAVETLAKSSNRSIEVQNNTEQPKLQPIVTADALAPIKRNVKNAKNRTAIQKLKTEIINPVCFKPFKLLPDEPKKPDETDALIALIVSAAGFFVLGIIASIIGLILAKKALKKIKAQPDKYGGEDLAELARIISIVGIVLFLILLVCLVIIISIVTAAI